MSEKQQVEVEALASQMEQANEKVLTTAAACSAEQWTAMVVDEGRSAGVVFHHIAYAYPFIIDWAAKVVGGQELPPVTYDVIHDINRRHAEDHAGVSQADTLALLRENGAALVAWIRTLHDQELGRSVPFALTDSKAISTRQVVEWFGLNHARNHLKAIQSTLE